MDLLRPILAVHTEPVTKRRWLHDNPRGRGRLPAGGPHRDRSRQGLTSSPSSMKVLSNGPNPTEWNVNREEAVLATFAM